MADCVKTLQVSLQQDGFCIATGPQDSAIVYPCPANPFAPTLLLDSPVVLHLHCPDLFPNEVLKVHAEHLGHFLALQAVPKMNDDLERTLFLGLCNLFTREKVVSLYDETLTDDVLRKALTVTSEGGVETACHPSVFVNFQKNRGGQIVCLLRKLIQLFDTDELRDYELTYEHGEEPQHMLFLYLIQLIVVFVSSCIAERDLATIMSVASAVFLEANFCHPLCAATVLKPMFIPYFEHQGAKKGRKGEVERETPETRLKYYRLFTGYHMEKESDVSNCTEMNLRWTEHSILDRMQGYKIVESGTKKFWFVAPQMGDRMSMVKDCGLKMMGGQAGAKAQKICSYLISDNVMAYMQCAVFGTISNMLPCHANSDLTETVMASVDNSLSRFSEVVRHQSANLMTELSKMTDSCLRTAGLGFIGQDKGKNLYFGNVFTGPEDKKPPVITQGKAGGVFTSVTLGFVNNTMMNSMLEIALKQNSSLNNRKGEGALHSVLSTGYKPSAGIHYKSTDVFLFARYHHKFNKGEFTEVACVKAINEPGYNSLVHEENLTNNSKYQLTVSHGALPMCTLTLAMTIRQTMMMVTGFICAELARVIYAPNVNDINLCKQVVNLHMAGKFKHKKDETSTNVFKASYGELLKFTGMVFGNPGKSGVNRRDLDAMEWLRSDDSRLPESLRRSLNMIGDTKKAVEKIMQDKNVSYNRVMFMSDNRRMEMATMFANDEYMVHAPLMVMTNMRIFTNSTSFCSVKLCRKGCYYAVKIFSNRCIDTKLYYHGSRNFTFLTGETKTTIDDMVAKIKREVSCVLPKIDANRIKMLGPELNEEEFSQLVSAVKNNNIEVVGHTSSTSLKENVSFENRAGVKRAREEEDAAADESSPHKMSTTKKEKEREAEAEDTLQIYNSDAEFGFDDSD